MNNLSCKNKNIFVMNLALKMPQQEKPKLAFGYASSPNCTPVNFAAAEDGQEKEVKGVSFSEEFTCSITRDLMVDPVLAEDGNTYERSALLKWLSTNNKSPLNPSQILHPDRLIGNRVVFACIEKMVMSSTFDKDLRLEWLSRYENLDLKKAQQLFNDGKLIEAAKLGLPEAAGVLADCYWSGKDGFEKDPTKSVMFAKQAVEGGDFRGQYLLGWAYFQGESVEKDRAASLKLATQAFEQGSLQAMNLIGCVYGYGGYGVPKDVETGFSWYEKGADAGDPCAQYSAALCCYEGEGTIKDLVAARHWAEKSAEQGCSLAKLMLGTMMAKGEGGERQIFKGFALVEEASKEDVVTATGQLEDILKLIDKSWKCASPHC